jgi:hypothetical protein
MVGSVLVFLAAAAAATPCESLVGLKLDKATITSATMVPEGPAPARTAVRREEELPRARQPRPRVLLP